MAATSSSKPTSKADADLTRTTSAPAETEAQESEATTADTAAEQTDDRVAVTLAHPIDDASTITRLRLDEKDGGYKVGEEVRVTPADARSLITAGYAQVDPEDPKAVADVLGTSKS